MVATLRAVGAGEIAPDHMQALLDKKSPSAVPPMVGRVLKIQGRRV
jgi:hypothetical protein